MKLSNFRRRTLRHKCVRQVALAVAIGLIALGAGRVEAILTVDQQQPVYSSGGGAINPPWDSFGQSFTPALSSIEWAEFVLENQSSPFTPIDLQLAILNGQVGSNGLGGAVLATSPVVQLSDTSFTTVHFQLAAPLALTPGQQYVLQVKVLTTNQGLGWEQAFEPASSYSGGQMLQAPYDTTILATQDYVFSEGIGQPPEDTGFVPPDANTGKCENLAGAHLKKLSTCMTKCQTKQADAARKGNAFDEEACENGTGKPVSCRAAYDKAQASLLAKTVTVNKVKQPLCPACLDAAAQSNLADMVISFVDSRNGQIYCAGTTALGGDDPGFVPPDANTGKCEDLAAAHLKKLYACMTKCQTKQANAARKGTVFDEEACEQGTGKPVSCRAAYDKAQAALLAKTVTVNKVKQPLCPACLDAAAQSSLADQVMNFIDSHNGQIYCAGTTPLP